MLNLLVLTNLVLEIKCQPLVGLIDVHLLGSKRISRSDLYLLVLELFDQ